MATTDVIKVQEFNPTAESLMSYLEFKLNLNSGLSEERKNALEDVARPLFIEHVLSYKDWGTREYNMKTHFLLDQMGLADLDVSDQEYIAMLCVEAAEEALRRDRATRGAV